MKVKLFTIADKPTSFRFELKRKDLQKLEARHDFQEMICNATLGRKQDFFELRGSYRVEISTSCDLCLVPLSEELNESFQIGLVSEESQYHLSEDLELSVDSLDMDYYQGEEIDLVRYFEDQLILDLPLAITCREDCKGLCSGCGANLNESQCNCRDDNHANPFAVLKDLKPDR